MTRVTAPLMLRSPMGTMTTPQRARWPGPEPRVAIPDGDDDDVLGGNALKRLKVLRSPMGTMTTSCAPRSATASDRLRSPMGTMTTGPQGFTHDVTSNVAIPDGDDDD